jgi:hypothetical protein
MITRALRLLEELDCCTYLLTTILRSCCMVIWAVPTMPSILPGLVMRNRCYTSCMIRGWPRTSQHSQVELMIKIRGYIKAPPLPTSESVCKAFIGSRP